MPRKLSFLFALLLVLDILYAAFQHYHGVLDGDMAGIILPAERYRQVLEDPFGFGVLFRNESYGGANRYFAHALMSGFFKTIPFFFRHFSDALTSVFLTCSVAKTGTQVLLIYVLSVFISGSYKIWNKDFLLAAVLVTPFFQTTGFGGNMSIIDASPTYVFFYAFGFGLVLLFFLPFFMMWFHGKSHRIGNTHICLLILFSIVIVFNGPLNIPVLLLVCPFLVLRQAWYYAAHRNLLPGNKSTIIRPIPGKYLLVFCFAIAFSLAAFYIGRNNSENFWNDTVSLSERYKRLPAGLYEFFISIKGSALLLLMVAFNAACLYRRRSDDHSRKLLRFLQWIVIFSAIYIVLLPLGGYRPYRPNIIKKDLILPVLLLLIIFYGMSSSYLLYHIATVPRRLYAAFVIIPLLVFTLVDKPGRGRDYCQKQSIKQLQDSPEKITLISSDCNILTWEKVTDYNASKTSMDMLRYWGVVKEEKYFYQK